MRRCSWNRDLVRNDQSLGKTKRENVQVNVIIHQYMVPTASVILSHIASSRFYQALHPSIRPSVTLATAYDAS